jgi:Na+/proline symporter
MYLSTLINLVDACVIFIGIKQTRPSRFLLNLLLRTSADVIIIVGFFVVLFYSASIGLFTTVLITGHCIMLIFGIAYLISIKAAMKKDDASEKSAVVDEVSGYYMTVPTPAPAYTTGGQLEEEAAATIALAKPVEEQRQVRSYSR